VELLERFDRPGEVTILAGDFNVEPSGSHACEALARLGFSSAGPAFDHVLVRGPEVNIALVLGAAAAPAMRGVALGSHSGRAHGHRRPSARLSVDNTANAVA
jgi:hypothetical protein